MHFIRQSPILVVDELTPSLHFWVDRLGFTTSMETDDGAFAQVEHGEIEIMLQTAASVARDVPHLAGTTFCSCLYIEVPDVELVVPVVADTDVVVPLRKTWYGMHEIAVRAPGGHLVTFASRLEGG